MAAIVGIVSRHSLTIKACFADQPNKSKLALCKPLLHLTSFKTGVYTYVTRWSASVMKVNVTYVGRTCIKMFKRWTHLDYR